MSIAGLPTDHWRLRTEEWIRKASALEEERDQLRARCGELEEALRFYADEDSELEAGGADGGKRALTALGLIEDPDA